MNQRTYLPAALAALTALCFPSLNWAANEVGFIEKFALAPDREKVLGELVPGSEDYYFFHALHFQNTRNEAKLEAILTQWKNRFPDENPRRRIIENREALLDYETTPEKTLAYLRERLGVPLDHQREVRDKKPNLPTVLDPKRVQRSVFEKDSLENDEGLESFSIEALEHLVRTKTPLKTQQRRALLAKLDRPDVAGLVELLITELKSEDNEGFGIFPIHKQLLPAQLDALAKAIPSLATDEQFIEVRMSKLAPSEDVDIAFDAVEREAWLDRAMAYARTLPGAYNSLKAHILYRRLEHDRKKGVYDAARFLEYLKLPRQVDYANEKWLGKAREDHMSELDEDLSELLPLLKPIGSDEELVRDYFLALFEQASKAAPARLGEGMMSPYTEFVRSSWLRPVLAEALILGGHGNPERWAPWLTPEEFQALKDRVDIEFPESNPPFLQPGEDVQFDVVVKNTPKLLVRVYELNALNYFLNQRRQLNTDLNLDGLVANSEEVHTFDSGPFLRTRQTFKFPALKGRRGAWVIEFIGGGRSSRALVRVGQWQVLQQPGPAGDMLLVVDEKGEPVKEAVAWLDGRKFTRDEKMSRIVIPFTAKPGNRSIVVSDPDGSFATLTSFKHNAEEYKLDARFHIEREQLLAGREATLAIRTGLTLGEAKLDPALIQEPRLSITSTTLDGISTTREVKDLKLSAGSVFTHSLTVPDRLSKLTATLTGKISVQTAGGEKRELQATANWTINEIDRTEATHDGHFSQFEGVHVYELLGKNGEPLAEQPIQFEFTHHGFNRSKTLALKTDEKGRVVLGALPGIWAVEATAPDGRKSRIIPAPAWRTHTKTSHAKTGDIVRIPWNARPIPGAAGPAGVATAEVSLLEVKNGVYTADHFTKISLKDGFLEIAGLPAGDFALRIRGEEEDTAIKVTDGRAANGWYLGKHRTLQVNEGAPIQITNIAAEKEVITIKLANASAFARVHIVGTRFADGGASLLALGDPDAGRISARIPATLPNLFSSEREIGDEYRYILERRAAAKFAGNMLPRPGLLLNRWAIRDTDVDALEQQLAQAAEGMDAGREDRDGATVTSMAMSKKGGSGLSSQDNLDFLATSAPVLYNLLPDKDGVVRIDRKALGDRQHVQVYAEDLGYAVSQQFALPEVPAKFADQRLARNLDPAKPFTQRRKMTVLEKGRTLTVADVRTSELETYDTLGGVHSLLSTLSNNATLAQFAWVLQWPQMKEEEKRANYDEFACHELNFFLFHKDADFFAKVIKPALANKKDKTFMDDFLLGSDLSQYLQPSVFRTLNTAERALLAQALPGEAAAIARAVAEQCSMQPADPEQQERLFETALRGRAMEPTEGRLALRPVAVADNAPAEPALPPMDAPAPPASPVPPPQKPGSGPANASSGAKGLKQIEERLQAGLSIDAKAERKLAELDGGANGAPVLGKAMSDARKRNWAMDTNGRDLYAVAGKLQVDFREGEKADAENRWDVRYAHFYGATDVAEIQKLSRAYYRTLGVTKEWAENHYYHLRIGQQDSALVPVSAFWRDYAQWVAGGRKGAFVSPHIIEASHTFAEMMLALAVLDLPFDAPKHTTRRDGSALTLTADGPVIVYHKEIKPAAAPVADAPKTEILVSQSFFRDGDRFRQEGNEKFEKYITDEFLTGTVYGANVVVTNPTSAPAKADVLLQIPRGALPVKGSKATDSRFVRLAPYTTQQFEYYFYFPATGAGAKFPHFPVNVSIGGSVVGVGKPLEFNVVQRLTQLDKSSWAYVSQDGTDAEVFTYLEQNNLAGVDFNRIAWRCHDAAFFKRITAFLLAHHVWNETIYSYALLHNEPGALREWIQRNDRFVSECGPWLSTKLVLLDPVQRRGYEHLEYSPLVNQRAHLIGGEQRIANPAVLGQYRSFLQILAHKPALDSADQMSLSYYLFLQDRVEEGLSRFKSVDATALPTRIQHDYLRCYTGFYENDLATSRAIAARYADYPIARWKTLFAGVSAQLDEIEGKAPTKPGDPAKADRENQQGELAATEPSFDFKVENKAITLTSRNLAEVTVNYYLIDPEFSFSSSPFVGADSSRFSIVKPSKSATHTLPKDKDTAQLALPAEFATANVLVEVVGAGKRKAQAYHANSLKLTLTENFGRLEARDAATDKPLPKAYVKVYARLKDGTVRFFKDGYTDLRGRFDYASINGPAGAVNVSRQAGEEAPSDGLDYQMLKPSELGEVDKMAVLILSEANGAATREVNPPRQ